MGNSALHAKLTAQLQAARVAQAGGGGRSSGSGSGSGRAAGTASGGRRGGDRSSAARGPTHSTPRTSAGGGAGAGGGGGRGDDADGEEVEIISGLDEYGRPIRSLTQEHKLEREDLKNGSRRGKRKRSNKVGRDGKRTAYFEDDDATLEELVRREKDTRAGVRGLFVGNVAWGGC